MRDTAFLRAILHLENSHNISSNWSKGVCISFEHHNFDNVPYNLMQLLDPSTLFEVSVITKIEHADIENLNYEVQGPLNKLKWLVNNVNFATPIQKLNICYSLCSIARYKLASNIFEQIDLNRLYPNEKFYYYMLSFILKNRNNPFESVDKEFENIKALIEEGYLSDIEIISVSSQANTWKIKSSALNNDLYKWFVGKGFKLAEELSDNIFASQLSKSHFYRSVAMIPAAENDLDNTRKYMDLSYKYAEMAEPKSEIQKIQRSDALKTYFESSLKEFAYLHKDYDKAEDIAKKLIEIDPNWSISYLEAAEVNMLFDNYNNALSYIKRAQEIGLPRVVESQFLLGYCYEKLEDYTQAVEAYKNTLALDPLNISAAVNGYLISKKLVSKSEETYFKSILNAMDENNHLNNEYKEMLQKI
ncbi:tetratricopeptide repeat protein [Paenibacillus faecalis]|uniref:tetratricopeptide repeat protein n=1 Tax=Paenibacillus faecalis TaxID=2079532 RepID=UPI000D0FC02F|nr:tetratricopeptide repeat protein [Paenibacillus faecalis]